MKNCLILTFLSLLFLGLTPNADAQVSFNFSDESADVNGMVEVDVTVSGFNNITITQYSINWDPSVYQFVDIINITTDLPDLNSSSFNDPNQTLDPGEITVSWNESGTNPQSLPDGTRLFSIKMMAVGNSGASTDINISDTPREIEVTDQNFNPVNVSSQAGTLSINGGGGGGSDLIGFTASTENALPGTNVCVEISVQNFADIQSLQSGLTWDPDVLSFTDVQNFNGLDGFSSGAFNNTNTDNGELRFLWTDPTAENPATLADGTVIFEACFDVVGNLGTSSPITFTDIGNFSIEFSDSDGASLDYENVNGRVNVQEQGGEGDFTLEIESVSASMGTEVCLSINTENFDDIISAQFTLSWDPSVINFSDVGNFGLDGINGTNFNLVSDDKLRFTWEVTGAQSGVDLPDGSTVFDVCFDVVGDCNAQPSTNVNFINDGSVEIEIVRGSTLQPISPLNLISGTVQVNPCGVNYQSTITNPDCPGEASGNIIVTVDGGMDNCNCTWEDANGNVLVNGTLGANNCNLQGQPAGTYTFKVNCSGDEIFSTTETIADGDGPSIAANVDPAACGELGSIDLTITGGDTPYTFAWTPDQGNVEDLADLQPGTYSVTVTDNNNCTASQSFTINEESSDLELTSSDVMDASCFGEEDGAISLVVDGGCTDDNGEYSFTWTDGQGNTISGGSELVDLAGGTYNLTITDFNSPAQMITRTFEVGTPSEIVINVASVSPSDNGDNGAIELNVTGGAGSYSYSWDPDQGNTDSPSGLAPGNYAVTVTDAIGCTAASENINVAAGGPTFGNIAVINLQCNEDGSGAISGDVTGGIAPITITLSGAASGTLTLNDMGSFSFDGLGAGTYKVTFTDDNGESTETNDLTITQPAAISLALDIEGVSEDGANDGKITANVTGGTSPYNYQWNVAGSSNIISNLAAGSYNLLITDANGCEFIRQNINVPSGGECFNAISIITPNNDGANDFFTIQCAPGISNNLVIFNRVGARVYDTNNYQNDWSGTTNDGADLPYGAYMWVLEVDFGQGNREIYSGTVTLIRDF